MTIRIVALGLGPASPRANPSTSFTLESYTSKDWSCPVCSVNKVVCTIPILYSGCYYGNKNIIPILYSGCYYGNKNILLYSGCYYGNKNIIPIFYSACYYGNKNIIPIQAVTMETRTLFLCSIQAVTMETRLSFITVTLVDCFRMIVHHHRWIQRLGIILELL